MGITRSHALRRLGIPVKRYHQASASQIASAITGTHRRLTTRTFLGRVLVSKSPWVGVSVRLGERCKVSPRIPSLGNAFLLALASALTCGLAFLIWHFLHADEIRSLTEDCSEVMQDMGQKMAKKRIDEKRKI